MKVKDIELTTRTVEVKGIVLPWEKWSTPPVFKDGKNLTPERGDESVLQDTGEVFISLEDLYELAEQDRWDSQFSGRVLLLGRDEGLALVAAGLAEQETRGGYHRTKKLQKLIDRLEGQ